MPTLNSLSHLVHDFYPIVFLNFFISLFLYGPKVSSG
jgi:hypothetical protein